MQTLIEESLNIIAFLYEFMTTGNKIIQYNTYFTWTALLWDAV
jgi:hypothetical protein